MTDWKKVTGTQPERPEEIDRTSSPSTVYLRKNIEQVEKEVEGADGKIQTVTEWQYDEKEMTVEEYENMALMKSVVEENTSGIVESVTQFQKDAKVRKMIASMAKAAAVNNKIGYDQSERYTFWEHLKASNYDPAQITIACEADCSSGVAAIVKGAGYRLGNEKMKNVSIYLYTGNMRAGLKAAGFEVLTDSKYLTSDAYLLEGDITLNDNAHVAVNLTDGAKSSGTGASNTTTVKSNAKVDVAHGFNKSLAGTYKVTASGLNLRAGAGTGKSILAVMKNGEKVQCYGYYNDCNGVKWLYVVYKNIVGYASSKYLSK